MTKYAPTYFVFYILCLLCAEDSLFNLNSLTFETFLHVYGI